MRTGKMSMILKREPKEKAGGDCPRTPCSPSSILAAKWREKANHCEAEIERSKGTKPTLHLSVAGRICYEQAARTLRQCADEIHSLENAEVCQPEGGKKL